MRVVAFEEHFVVPALVSRIDPAAISRRGFRSRNRRRVTDLKSPIVGSVSENADHKIADILSTVGLVEIRSTLPAAIDISSWHPGSEAEGNVAVGQYLGDRIGVLPVDDEVQDIAAASSGWVSAWWIAVAKSMIGPTHSHPNSSRN